MFNPIAWALKRPVTVLTLSVGLLLSGLLAISRMRVDIFPNLNLPVIYVCQPYGGMDPSQMEGLLTNYYEYHFLYINGSRATKMYLELLSGQGVMDLDIQEWPKANNIASQ